MLLPHDGCFASVEQDWDDQIFLVFKVAHEEGQQLGIGIDEFITRAQQIIAILSLHEIISGPGHIFYRAMERVMILIENFKTVRKLWFDHTEKMVSSPIFLCWRQMSLG